MHNKPNINVTPLIDVLLVLLIIFMAISPRRPSRFVAQVPDKSAPEIPNVIIENETLQVLVKADGTYSLNSQPAATLSELNDWLHRALDGRPFDRKTVFLKAPPGMAYGHIAQVIDVMKSAGLTEDADASQMFILRADGSIISRRDRGGNWFSSGDFESIALMPGDAIVVPALLDRENRYNFVTRVLKDWTQIFANFGLGVAAIRSINKN